MTSSTTPCLVALLLLLEACGGTASPETAGATDGAPGDEASAGGDAIAPADAGSESTVPDVADATVGGATDAGREAGAADAGVAESGVDGATADAATADAATADAGDVCAGTTGALHAQPFSSGGLARHYFLYVPAAYDCHAAPWPLLIDFHGTASGTEADNPEESWTLSGMIAEADAQHFIVARPRSLFGTQGGLNIYQWDIGANDLQVNAAFARELVHHLQSTYHIDSTRIYASGFSNGTNMASQFLGDVPPVFHGLAVVGGGLWDTPAGAARLGDPAQRVYAATGYREYLYPYHDELLAYLSTAALPAGQIFVRPTNAGHELYRWHYRELFEWLDRGVKPPAGTLTAAWRDTGGISTRDDLLKIAALPDGSRIVSASHGALFRQATANAAWVSVGQITGTDGSAATTVAPNLAGMCIDASGAGVAVGNGILTRTTNGGATWSAGAQIPPFGPFGFEYSEIFAVGCAPGVVSGGGYTAVALSHDHGLSWSAGSALQSASFPAQLNAFAVGPSGTWVAAGYYGYLGRSTDGGASFTEVDPSPPYQWFNGLASAPGGLFWAVGEAGAIYASRDDGATWVQQGDPSGEDLYAVSFFDANRGIAVGAHGAAVYTANGGATWTDVSTGLDGYLGDVAWQSASTAVAVGQAGGVLTYSPP
jgi:poly(3-hydroxybutyrate) depolymerase/photosystem II stability/assembly factor-like uncharacterized protein